MEIIQVISLGIISSFIYIIVKEFSPSFAFLIILVTSTFIFIFVLKKATELFVFIESLGKYAHVDTLYLKTILKIIGIAYLVEIGIQITKDAGLNSVSKKIELAGKMTILLISLPIIQAVLKVIIQFISFSD